MDVAVLICEIVSGIAAVGAIISSALFYKHGLNRERKIDTIRSLSEIRRKYFNPRELSISDKIMYLNELEYFATGIEAKIYDIQIVKKMSGTTLIRNYVDWAADFISNKRTFEEKENVYLEYEKMIKTLKEM